MPIVKWKLGVLWTLVLAGGVLAGPDGPVKWDLLDLFGIKNLPHGTGIKAAKSNYCSDVSYINI
jgi:hypothetical protein